jgi:hypothetical protein
VSLLAQLLAEPYAVQAVLSQLEIVNSVSSSVHSSSRNAFTAFIFMIVLSTVLNSAIFILAAFSLGFENRKLMMITAFSLPIAAFLLWCTVAATYGVWISAKDICSASALYSGSGSSSITDAIQTRLAPCPAPQSAALLGEHGKRAYLALVRRANQLVSGTYLLLWITCGTLPENRMFFSQSVCWQSKKTSYFFGVALSCFLAQRHSLQPYFGNMANERIF